MRLHSFGSRLSPRQHSRGTVRGTWLFVFATSVCSVIPVWLAPLPPMTDLPQHAAQVALLRGVLDGSSPYRSLFDINWFTPYLLGYFLLYCLAPFVGLLIACKLVVSLALGGMSVATALLMDELGTDPRWAVLSNFGLYGFAYQWGFLNYLVTAPVGLLFLWGTLRYVREPTQRKAVLLALAFIGLFFCHALICAFFGLIAGLMIVATAPSLKAASMRVLPLVAAIPFMIGWTVHTSSNPATHRPVVWDLNWLVAADGYYAHLATWTAAGGWGWGRLTGLFPRTVGLRDNLAVVLSSLTVLLLPVLAGGQLTRQLVRWLPLLCCTAALFILPNSVFVADFTHQRFALFLLPFYLILFAGRPEKGWPRWLWGTCAASVAAWLLLVANNVRVYARESEGFLQVLEHMAPDDRAAYFAFDYDSRVMIAPVFLHLGSWYSALRHGVVDPSFAGTHVTLVLYRTTELPAARLWGQEWKPDTFDWTTLGHRYRYFIVRSRVDRSTTFGDAPCAVLLRYRSGDWWLYEQEPTCHSAGATAPR